MPDVLTYGTLKEEDALPAIHEKLVPGSFALAPTSTRAYTGEEISMFGKVNVKL